MLHYTARYILLSCLNIELTLGFHIISQITMYYWQCI